MTDDNQKQDREQARQNKTDRLSDALRENLRKRKALQRDRGANAPSAIKNKNRLTD